MVGYAWPCGCCGSEVLIACHCTMITTEGSGQVSSLNPNTGGVLWTTDIGSEQQWKRRAVGSVIDSNGNVYVGWDLVSQLSRYTQNPNTAVKHSIGGVTKLDSDGAILWNKTFPGLHSYAYGMPLDDEQFASVQINSDDEVYFASSASTDETLIYKLDEDGNISQEISNTDIYPSATVVPNRPCRTMQIDGYDRIWFKPNSSAYMTVVLDSDGVLDHTYYPSGPNQNTTAEVANSYFTFSHRNSSSDQSTDVKRPRFTQYSSTTSNIKMLAMLNSENPTDHDGSAGNFAWSVNQTDFPAPPANSYYWTYSNQVSQHPTFGDIVRQPYTDPDGQVYLFGQGDPVLKSDSLNYSDITPVMYFADGIGVNSFSYLPNYLSLGTYSGNPGFLVQGVSNPNSVVKTASNLWIAANNYSVSDDVFTFHNLIMGGTSVTIGESPSGLSDYTKGVIHLQARNI